MSNVFTSQQIPFTNGATYIPTVTAMGTVTNNVAIWQRAGGSIRVNWFFITGTVGASLASISLPPGLAIDSTKLPVVNTTGNAGPLIGSWAQNATANVGGMVAAASTSTSLIYFGISPTGTNHLTPQNGSDISGNTVATSGFFEIPISQFAF